MGYGISIRPCRVQGVSKASNRDEGRDGVVLEHRIGVLTCDRKGGVWGTPSLRERHGMVVWRFHDHWHMRKPDGIEAGMVRSLGWEKFQNSENQYLFVMPETTVKKLAEEVARKLDSPVVRVVGEPEMKVTKVGFSPGAAGFERETHALERDDVQVLLVGETREWETVEYAADAVAQGRNKALIVIGHVPSEQAGMEECTRWLKGFVKGVPVEFVATKEPFWTVSEKE